MDGIQAVIFCATLFRFCPKKFLLEDPGQQCELIIFDMPWVYGKLDSLQLQMVIEAAKSRLKCSEKVGVITTIKVTAVNLEVMKGNKQSI